MAKQIYRMTADEVLGMLRTSRSGLSGDEARRRLKLNGPNLIRKEDLRGPWPILFR